LQWGARFDSYPHILRELGAMFDSGILTPNTQYPTPNTNTYVHKSMRHRIGLRPAGTGFRAVAGSAAEPTPADGCGVLRAARIDDSAHYCAGVDVHDDGEGPRHAGGLRVPQPQGPFLR